MLAMFFGAGCAMLGVMAGSFLVLGIKGIVPLPLALGISTPIFLPGLLLIGFIIFRLIQCLLEDLWERIKR